MICTGQSAYWCPNCGDCTCERAYDGDCCFDNLACPLHGSNTKHADTIELADCEEKINEMAAEFDVELSDNDRAELSRFAQFIYSKSRKQKTIE